jgi:transcriptional regulator with XRE-family HTH domain
MDSIIQLIKQINPYNGFKSYLFTSLWCIKPIKMNIGDKIKKAREAKGLSQKEVATALKMDQSQYSKIENGKTDPYFSTIEKIAKALSIKVSDLLTAEDIFKDVDSLDKTIVEKVQLIEQLDENEKKSIFSIIDGLSSKKKMKDSLAKALAQ